MTTTSLDAENQNGFPQFLKIDQNLVRFFGEIAMDIDRGARRAG